MTGSKGKRIIGTMLTAPAAMGAAWTIRKMMTSADGALAHEESEGKKKERVKEVLKKTSHSPGFQQGAMPEPMEAGEHMRVQEPPREKIREVKQTAEDVARQTTGAAQAAGQAAMTAAPGMFAWMRNNTKKVLGFGLGAFALLGFMRWRRHRNADES